MGPTSVVDLNTVGVEEGKFASNLGTAHEFLVTGILMRLGFDVSVSSVKGGPYDLLVTAYESGPHSQTHILRAAVKTAGRRGDIRFIGGVRAGVNRVYLPGVGKYKYGPEHNDLVIGVDRQTLDLYLIPTRFLEHFGESRTVGRLQSLKNNWDVLLYWNEEFLGKFEEIVVR